jgi:hypothetical protein
MALEIYLKFKNQWYPFVPFSLIAMATAPLAVFCRPPLPFSFLHNRFPKLQNILLTNKWNIFIASELQPKNTERIILS